MPLIFDGWTIEQADEALTKRKNEYGEKAQLFYDGDHWQGSMGWNGQLPPANSGDYQQVIAQIAASFVFENAIKAVVDRHVGGVLGREPSFALVERQARLAKGKKPAQSPASGKPVTPAVTPAQTPQNAQKPPQTIEKPSSGPTTPASDADTSVADEQRSPLIEQGEAALTGEWWDRRKPVQTLKHALRFALLQGRAVLRLYVPSGLRDESGGVKPQAQEGQEPLDAALNLVYCDALNPKSAGVVIDDDTKREVGIFRYERDGKAAVELTYLAEDNVNTVLRVIVEGETDQRIEFPLNGRILMYELERDALITAGVIQLQKVINHTRTMIGRNVNMAGFRERTYTNAARPGRWVDSTGGDVEQGTPGAKFVEGDMPLGAGATNYLVGVPVYNDEGEIVSYTSPGVQYADPVDPTSLIKVRDDAFGAILHEVHQRHILISGDAAASGESRKQARSEYERDLGSTKLALDDAGRWLVETALHHASFIAGSPLTFRALRAEFSARVDAGPITAEEEKALTERYEKKLLSKEGAMERQGVEDVQAERQRLADEENAAIEREDAAMARMVNVSRRPVASAGADEQQQQDDNAAA